MSDDVARSMYRMYRLQRHFYDLTRKYYLLGRDELVDRLGAAPGDVVLEVGCGTARNLVRLARRYPGARLHGLDASEAMLLTAAAKLARAGLDGRVPLAHGFAQTFKPADFGLDRPFDRILFSYTLSIIPGPVEAQDNAFAQLRPGGSLHTVDFGDRRNLPRWLDRLLGWWLGLFGVEHRPAVGRWFREHAAKGTGRLEERTILGRYAEFLKLEKA